MMKRICWIALLLLVLPGVGRAQVSKQVEVTKAYELHLEEAEKYTIRPDMTDTMRLRPDIDYTVTPLSFETSLATRPIRPAKVTYWEFNRPKPYYLKAGFGLPLQSIAEFSLSTQHPDTGYALGYLNHQGRYAKIENDFGVKEPATRLWTELGGAAGKYLGRHILEGDVRYTHRALRRYGMALPSTMEPIGDGVGYSDLEASIRLVKGQHTERVSLRAAAAVEDRLVELLTHAVKRKPVNPLDILLGNKPKEPELSPEDKSALAIRQEL